MKYHVFKDFLWVRQLCIHRLQQSQEQFPARQKTPSGLWKISVRRLSDVHPDCL